MMAPDRARFPGRRLGELLAGLADAGPAAEVLVTGVAADSRRVRPGDLFLACAGRRTHGLAHLDQAIAAGAAAVAWEPPFPGTGAAEVAGVPLVPVERLGERAGLIADRFFLHPSRDLAVVGVTGTDGKTSCAHFLARALDRPAARCGLMGTLGHGLPGALAGDGHTTPDAVTVHARLDDLRRAGARWAVMEVSSHALDQGRIEGVDFDVAVLTNLTRDHLDYHGDVEAYARAKRRLFARPGLEWAVLNADDATGARWLAEPPGTARLVAYGVETEVPAGAAWVVGRGLRADAGGIAMDVETSWGAGRIEAPLLGRFNAWNLLAALAVLLCLETPVEEACARLARVRAAPGRMERFGGGPGAPLVVVDYAHTPHALEQALAALRPLTAGRLWCVFGCGGERDRGKRPAMGRVAETLADHVVVTDDNPRGEDATQIVVEILAGMRDPDRAYVIRDREAAIHHAVGRARPGDTVLVAGKGHEGFQIVGDERRPFSDRAVVVAALGGEAGA